MIHGPKAACRQKGIQESLFFFLVFSTVTTIVLLRGLDVLVRLRHNLKKSVTSWKLSQPQVFWDAVSSSS